MLLGLIVFGCAVGGRDPSGSDWSPLQGQEVVGVNTSATDASNIGSSGSGSNTGGAPPSETSEAVEELTAMLTTDAIYVVSVEFGMTDRTFTLECDSDKDLLIRWGISKYGEAVLNSDTSFSMSYPSLPQETMEASLSEFTVGTYPTSGYTERSKAIIEGICLPLGG